MEWSFVFFLNSALLGVGLAMDAFSVSMANGLHDPLHEQGNHVQDRGHLCPFSGRDAHDGLGVRAHHCGAVLFV